MRHFFFNNSCLNEETKTNFILENRGEGGPSRRSENYSNTPAVRNLSVSHTRIKYEAQTALFKDPVRTAQ